ncbi:hypothetical protein RB200_07500 [Streptomyces sp. PmtG]
MSWAIRARSRSRARSATMRCSRSSWSARASADAVSALLCRR